MDDILVPARAGGYAVAAFEFWSLDSAQAVVEAAEDAAMPVILQTGPLEIEFAGIESLARIATRLAEAASVKVALHLDHGDTLDLAKAAVASGFTSVMIDASHLPYAENVALTREVVALAAPHNVTVESELGRLAGSEAGKTLSEEEAAQTDPDQAGQFVEETGIHALAVAIGTGHGFYPFPPKLNLERLRRIAGKVAVPLVLHGGSDTPADLVRRAIALGVAKVNICTEFVAAFGKAYALAQEHSGFRYNVPALFGPAKAAGKQLAREKIELFRLNRR